MAAAVTQLFSRFTAAHHKRFLERYFCVTTMAPNTLTHIVSGRHSACELQIGVYDGIFSSTTNDQQLALLEGFVGAAPKGRELIKST